MPGALGTSGPDVLRIADRPVLVPDTVTLPPRGTQKFAPFIASGSGTGYTMAITTDGSHGMIDSSSGVYMAGRTGSTTDVVTLTDSESRTFVSTVTITAAITIAPTPAALVSLTPLGTASFAAAGGSNATFKWSLLPNMSGGSIGADSGSYVAGRIGSVTDTVMVTDSLGNIATYDVKVKPAITIIRQPR